MKDNCGDELVDPGEQCDGANLASATCETLGHYNTGGTLSCQADCTFDRTDCGGRCGDAEIQDGDGEECDGVNFGDQSCTTFGYHGGYLVCTSSCTIDVSVCGDAGACGDGIIQDNYGEECDGEALDGASCESLGYTSGTLLCSDGCLFDTVACQSVCGNGLLETTEACDDQNTEPGDGCDAACGQEEGWDCTAGSPSVCTPICGDGLIVGDEDCEGADLGGMTCGALGFSGGVLACDGQCRFTTGGCNRWLALDAGEGHTCAVAEDHSLWCWGDNQYGQLGNGGTTDSAVPVAVSGMATDVMAVATGGGHTCAIKLGGALWCWGRNTYGQLGIGNTTGQLTPAQVPSETFASIRLGPLFSCGIRTSGTVACWGANSSGQVGLSGNNQHSPYTIGAVSGAIAVSCGGLHACALNSSGAGFCWGADYEGQLADGTTSNTFPHQVAINSAANLGLGENHTCYLSSSGGMYCAGSNSSGQLGNGTTNSQTSTGAVTNMINSVLYIDGGFNSTCAVKTDGSVHCWGLNDHGQLGCGNLQAKLVASPVTGLSAGFVEVHAGKYHACALSGSGFLMCWGENENGQLGDGGTTDRLTPVPVVF